MDRREQVCGSIVYQGLCVPAVRPAARGRFLRLLFVTVSGNVYVSVKLKLADWKQTNPLDNAQL